MKKIIYSIFGIFVLLNVILYISFYITFVLSAPTEYKNARFNLINAHFISFYEIYPIKINLIDYQNPILTPVRTAKRYFYEKGIKELPHNEVETATWYGLIEFIPLYKDMINKGSLKTFNTYGEELTLKTIKKSYEYIKVISKHEQFLDIENKRLKKSVLPLFYKFYQHILYNFNLPDTKLTWKQIRLKNIKDNKKINKIKEVYLMRLNFFNKAIYLEEVKRISKKFNQFNLLLTDIFATSLILENILINKNEIPDTSDYQLIYKKYIQLQKELKEYKKNGSKNILKIIDKHIKRQKNIYPKLNQKNGN